MEKKEFKRVIANCEYLELEKWILQTRVDIKHLLRDYVENAMKLGDKIKCIDYPAGRRDIFKIIDEDLSILSGFSILKSQLIGLYDCLNLCQVIMHKRLNSAVNS
jgi:hypothetical protein